MLVHERSELEYKLVERGATLASYFVRAKCANYRAGEKEKEVTSSDICRMYVDENDRAALTEVALMDATEKKEEMDEIKEALQALQFKPNPAIPDLSDGVIEHACGSGAYVEHEDYDVKHVQSLFPSLDANTIVELMKRSDYDLRACTIMIGGKYYTYMLHKILVAHIMCHVNIEQ